MTCEAQAKKVRDSNPELYKEYHKYAVALAEQAAGLLFHFGTAVETCQITSDGKIDLYRELDDKGIWHTSAERQAWAAAAGAWAEGFLQTSGVEYIIFPKDVVRGSDDDSIRRHAVAVN
jgi:hypothetical protein